MMNSADTTAKGLWPPNMCGLQKTEASVQTFTCRKILHTPTITGNSIASFCSFGFHWNCRDSSVSVTSSRGDLLIILHY